MTHARRAPRRPFIAAGIAGAAAIVTAAAIGVSASADSAQTDGLYGCAFNSGAFDCSPTVAPTVTETATATVTQTVTPSPSPTVTTPSPSPSPTTSRRLVGASFGGSSAANVTATTNAFPEATVGRFYFSGDPTSFANSPGLSAIPQRETVFLSFKTAVATVKSGAFDATFQSLLLQWNATGRTIYWTWQHEADDPAKGINPADYVAGWQHLLADERAAPSPNVHSMTVLMAYALTPGFPHGNPESWYVPGVDVLGFDSYSLNTEQLAATYAAGKGKPLAYPEVGDGVTAGQSDAHSLSFARQFVAALVPNVFGFAWFNAGVNTLTTRPQTLAYLRTLP